MDDYQRAKEEDHKQLLQMLMELKEDNEKVMRVVKENGTQVTEVLGLMQTVRSLPPPPLHWLKLWHTCACSNSEA